jgi:hypothetical protein
MKTEIFNIAIPVSAARAEQAGASLKAIPGVREVTYLDRPARLEALVDDNAPPRGELVAVLNQAGVLIDAERKPHAGGGSCCGSCGG